MGVYMIPKIIHYCWFGGNQISELGAKCIDSWKKYCPDYQIILWDEKSFCIDFNKYTIEAAGEKKWAFVSDVARLNALYKYGGIYLDTDVEIVKPIDWLLDNQGVIGFEDGRRLSTSFIACEKNNNVIRELLRDYEGRSFYKSGVVDNTPNVKRITKYFIQHGLKKDNSKQIVEGFTVLPTDYLSPKNHFSKQTIITKNTHAIHHFEGSWENEEDKYKHEIIGKIMKYGIPVSLARWSAKIISVVRYRGIKGIAFETRKLFR